MTRPDAILLVGPTGCGKTPLGERLQRRGLWGRPCRHFDFGERMRRLVAGGEPRADLTPGEIGVLRAVLRCGALLEDEHWTIAEKILRAFLGEGAAGSDELIVLNGLPRHTGQAEAIEAVLTVRAAIELACTPAAVSERIRRDVGGDRAGRTDDDEAAMRDKLAVFAARSLALLDHYRRRGAAVETVRVGVDTTAEDVRRMLEGQGRSLAAFGDAPC